MIQLALIGVWHVHASDYTKQTQQTEGAEIKKVWDKDAGRASDFAKDYGLDVVENLEDILNDEAVDGVIICTETADHDEVIARCAKSGKAIFTEKTLAISSAAANELAALIRDSQVPFVISYPQMTHPATLQARAMLDQGVIGDIVKLRFRNAHGGKAAGWLPAYWYDVETAGGGALMDLGCHPVYLANSLLGRPTTVSCTLSPATKDPAHADDEATVVLGYGDDVHTQAILETSFMTPHSPRMFELYGSQASLLAYNEHVEVLGVEEELKTEEVKMPLPVFVELVTAHKADPTAPLEDSCYGLDQAVMLAEVLEAAYISAAEGRVVTL